MWQQEKAFLEIENPIVLMVALSLHPPFGINDEANQICDEWIGDVLWSMTYRDGAE